MRKLINPCRFQYRKLSLVIGVILAFFWVEVSNFYKLTPIEFLKQSARILVVPIYFYIYQQDMKFVEETTRNYRIGYSNYLSGSSFESWKRLEEAVPGFRLISYDAHENPYPIPFVYENPNAKYLQAFRAKYHLDSLIRESRDEYDAMLRLGAWLGTRWDHGTDMVPGGNTVCNPVAVVQAGERGAKFWCEIAAKTTVHAATALGWQARLVTASRDGYTWEHAVAELWSNRFNKWFVMDTDFNVVYENSGIPLSAFELSRIGEQLKNKGQLTVRSIAEQKKSLPLADLILFYNYVHIDMRNDWCSRPLSRGSPAGGDYATWWTARPLLDKLLTSKTRVDDQEQFDWKINTSLIELIHFEQLNKEEILLEIEIKGYSPVYNSFELFLNDKMLNPVRDSVYRFSVSGGEYKIIAKLVTKSTYFLSPISQIRFTFLP